MTAADREPPSLPTGLRERVLEASRQARAAGRPVPAVPEISAAEAFSRAADAFNGLLSALGEDDWRTPVLRGLDVQGLVGHLIGMERDVQRCLSGDPDVADACHVESTQAAAVWQTGRPAARTRADWRRAADRTLSLVRAAPDPDAVLALHGLRLPLRALLVARAFELWTHENDIRRAVGWAASAPDASTLSLMTDLAARLLPHAADRAGLREPVDVHLVLTGPGGGTWDLMLGQGTPSPAARPAPPGPSAPVAVAIVADAVGFCRLAANRITPAELDVFMTGDPDRAAEVLAAACTLALD
jgi:uncharacterized protein (TIGR03083 family)